MANSQDRKYRSRRGRVEASNGPSPPLPPGLGLTLPSATNNDTNNNNNNSINSGSSPPEAPTSAAKGSSEGKKNRNRKGFLNRKSPEAAPPLGTTVKTTATKGNQQKQRKMKTQPHASPAATLTPQASSVNLNTASTSGNSSSGTKKKTARKKAKKKKPIFCPYLSSEDLQTGLKSGTLHRAVLRCNPGDRTQGFCTIPGLPHDVFIRGWKAQNRAVEGDAVAVRIFPPEEWYNTNKNATATENSTSSNASNNIVPMLYKTTPSSSSAAATAIASEDQQGGSLRTPSRMTPPPAPAVTVDADAERAHAMREMTPPVWAPSTSASFSSSTVLGSTPCGGRADDDLMLESQGRGGSDLLASPALLPASASGGDLGLAFSPDLKEEEEFDSDNDTDYDEASTTTSIIEKKAVHEVEAKICHLQLEGTLESSTIAQLAATLRDMPGYRATGEVVGILEPSSRRQQLVGVVRPGPGGPGFAFLVPCDPRMPRVLLPVNYHRMAASILSNSSKRDTTKELLGKEKEENDEEEGQEGQEDAFEEESASPAADISDASTDPVAHILVRGALTSWEDHCLFPYGVVDGVLGPCGELGSEVRALLEMEGVQDDDQFNEQVVACLPASPWAPTEQEIQTRKDLRDIRIFSIDPPTARDLDDALSIEILHHPSSLTDESVIHTGTETSSSTSPYYNNDDNDSSNDQAVYRIGVHIADVSHFVQPGTALDEEAAARSTSTYLPNRVIPMLPRPLCEELCSLNPGVERYAFSVMWDMTELGIIKKTWIGRTIIRSCAKLSYNMVQDMIDATNVSSHSNVPPEGVTLHGPYTWQQVREDSLRLYKVAMNLRKRRYANGALRLDNTRLYFRLNEAGLPHDYEVYQQKEANQLVEEFMLAANITTARVVSAMFPDRALLRRHPPPNAHKMKTLVETVKHMLPSDAPCLDCSSAGALQTTLREVCSYCGPGSPLAEVVTLMCTKPMQTAQYFCTGDDPDAFMWRHYALAVQQYTHFTSPIRRYPDVIVHRLLAAAIEKHGHDWTVLEQQQDENQHLQLCNEDKELCESYGLLGPEELSVLAAHANSRKAAAKAVQDGCAKLYLALLLLDSPKLCQGVILNLGGSKFFDVYIPAFGIDVRIHTEDTFKGGAAALKTVWDVTTKCLVLDRAHGYTDTKKTGGELSVDDIPNAKHVLEQDSGNTSCEVERMVLPLTLRPLTPVSLLVGARKSRSGSPAKVVARLWID